MLEMAVAFVKTNPLLAGMGGATAFGYLFSHVRGLPSRVWNAVREQLSTELTVYSDDGLFEDFDRWISDHSHKRTRRFVLASWWSKTERSDEFALAPGAGIHRIYYKGKTFWIDRTIMNKPEGEGSGLSGSKRRTQTVRITTLGRSTNSIRDLLNDIFRSRRNKDSVPIYTWDGYNAEITAIRPKRSMDTVYCSDAIKADLINDITRFLASKDEYARRGTPHRRGYLFSGPTGTGKTTMILALASLIERPLYIISASAIANDKDLMMVMSVAKNAVVVLEDIDSLPASESRDTAEKVDVVNTSTGGITLSGLLNAIDGLGSIEGRILIITTNKPEILDSALLRPGRIDRHFVMGKAGVAETTAMFARFFPDGDVTAFLDIIGPELPMAQAEIQNRLLAMLP